MAAGLSVDDVVRVSVTLTPTAAPSRNFGALAILGETAVIDTASRFRQYTSIDGVATDFGTTTGEYLAADLFFSQDPKPSICYIARWAGTATSGVLNGAQNDAQDFGDMLTALQAVSAGGMTISVDGTPHALSSLDFHSITNLNGAATVLGTALTQATVVWNAGFGRFEITSKTSSTTSTVGYGTDGTDNVATLMGLTQNAGASAPVDGIVAETPVAALQALAGKNGDIYGMMFAPTGTTITDQEYLDAAAYIEATRNILGITTQEAGAIDPSSSTDLAYRLSKGNYSRSFCQYSSSSKYAVASMYGRAFTVDFTANNTVITLKFKQEPGVVAETFNETQWAALKAKNCNVFVNYQNGKAIIQEGVMSSGIFFDERHGADYMQNRVQTDIFNALYTSPTKIPQTDPGVHKLATVAESSLDALVNNGWCAPGVWNSSLEFGQLKSGQMLTKGFYIFLPPISSQSQSDREARKAPIMQIAAKTAGAVHSADVQISVNR